MSKTSPRKGVPVHRWNEAKTKCKRCGTLRKVKMRKPNPRGLHRAKAAKVADVYFSVDKGETWIGPCGQYKPGMPVCSGGAA